MTAATLLGRRGLEEARSGFLPLDGVHALVWKGSALRQIKETDWKVLRRLHRLALERFCERVLAEVDHVIDNKARSAHERYLNIYRILGRRDRDIAALFNDPKRSRGLTMLAGIRSEGLLTEEEFSSLSPEARSVIEMLLSDN